MEYDIYEHKHRFSIWTAARAVQRSFTTTLNISLVINNTNLRDFAESKIKINSQEEFDSLQRFWSNLIIDEFNKLEIDASYGRAAKMVAVYLKTSIIIGAKPTDPTINFIHPPIDRIILKNLSTIKAFKEFRKLNWTKLDEQSYWQVVDTIRKELNMFNWKLELSWHPSQEKD
jgi:hypothetical protein